MRRYLATLHTRSDDHKKRFALATSGGFTLLIFAIWMTVNYGGEPVVADARQAEVKEVSPLESFSSSVGTAWEGLKQSFGGLSEGFGDVNFDTYGR